MTRFLIILLFVAGAPLLLTAQHSDAPTEGRFERIRAAKEAFIREELALTAAEAAAFFPVYWRYEVRLLNLQEEDRMQRRTGRRLEATQPISETDARERLRDHQRRRLRRAQLHTEAEEAYLGVLPASKVLELKRVEQDFRKKLLRRIKQNRGRGRN